MSCTQITYNKGDSIDFTRYPTTYVTFKSSVPSIWSGLRSYEQELLDYFKSELQKTSSFTQIQSNLADSLIDSLPSTCLRIVLDVVYLDGSTETKCHTESNGGFTSTVCNTDYTATADIACTATDSTLSQIKATHLDGKQTGSVTNNNYDTNRGAVKDALAKAAMEFSKGFRL
jgi:hypothetical protein